MTEVLAAVAALGWIGTSLLLGLWLGERRYRHGLERQLGLGGRPGKPVATSDPDAETRLLELDQGLAVERVTERLLEMNPKLSNKRAKELADVVSGHFGGGLS